MSENEHRYEYRAFSDNFGLLERRLRQSGGSPLIRESDELYLLSASAKGQNVKIRDGQLDIKVLNRMDQGMEQWQPLGKWGFPLPAEGIDHLLRSLDLDPMPDLESVPDIDQLVRTLCRERRVIAVELFKRRFGFQIGPCLAEIAELHINGAALRTACVESVDPGAVKALVDRLGLGEWPNTSYVKALSKVTSLHYDLR